jgi:hypothetical protein
MRRRIKLDTSTTIHDFSFLMKVLMVFFLVILITLINPPKKAEESPLVGDIVIESYWDDQRDVDVDLWIQGPGDTNPVGFSRRSDVQSSFLRDDVGFRNDSSGRNFEIAAVRGIKEGLYIVDVHLYSTSNDVTPGPIKVKVIGAITRFGYGRREIFNRTVELKTTGHEDTAASFSIDSDGNLVPGSVQFNYVPLIGNPEIGREP